MRRILGAAAFGMLALLALLAATVASAQQTASQQQTVRVGFRADAQPFSYAAPDAPHGYAGYLAELCIAIVDRIGARIEPVRVDVTDRFAALARDGDPAWSGPPIDLLCDPTTLTLERAAQWRFTPIVFVAGISFLWSDTADQAAFGAANRARESVPKPRRLMGPAGRLPFCAEADADPAVVVANRVAYLGGTTAAHVVGRPAMLDIYRPRADETVCVVEVSSHASGLDLLCRGEIAFYFGDRDILVAKLENRRVQTPDCDARASLRFVSYEPYALIVGDPALQVPVQRAVYALFSEGLPRRLFAANFGEKKPTPLLEALFTTNAVEPR